MTLRQIQNSLEHRRLLRLASEYRDKGYRVTMYPGPEVLPPILAECSLDLIAENGTEVVAVEVRTREHLSLNGCNDLRRISESVRQLPGWQLELVVTNPRHKAS